MEKKIINEKFINIHVTKLYNISIKVYTTQSDDRILWRYLLGEYWDWGYIGEGGVAAPAKPGLRKAGLLLAVAL